MYFFESKSYRCVQSFPKVWLGMSESWRFLLVSITLWHTFNTGWQGFQFALIDQVTTILTNELEINISLFLGARCGCDLRMSRRWSCRSKSSAMLEWLRFSHHGLIKGWCTLVHVRWPTILAEMHHLSAFFVFLLGLSYSFWAFYRCWEGFHSCCRHGFDAVHKRLVNFLG